MQSGLGESTSGDVQWKVSEHFESYTEDVTTQLMTIPVSTVEIVTIGKSWFDKFGLSLLSALFVLCFFSNILIIIAFIKFPNIRTPTNYLLCNLAVGDLVSGVLSIFYAFYTFTNLGSEISKYNRYACIIPITGIMAISLASVSTFFAISIERVIAVLTPLRYRTLVTKRKVILVIWGIWVIFCVFTVTPVAGVNGWEPGVKCTPFAVYPSYMLGIVFAVPMVMEVVGIANAMVAGVAFRRLKNFTNANNPDDLSGRVHLKQQVKQNKITRMLLMVVGSFYICWLPLSILIMYGIATSSLSSVDSTLDTILSDVCRAIRMVNTIVNPIIYASQNERFYKAFKAILLCKLQRTA